MIDPVEIKIIDILQFPLHIMDFTLISKHYMNQRGDLIIEEIKNYYSL